MTQTIKLRRSSTASAVPTTGQLDLGEVAINTYDGKVYFKKDDGVEAIVQLSDTSHSHSGITPSGGDAGQVLKKDSGSDYDYSWQDDDNSGVWGSITGTLSNQTDLQNALNAKAASGHDHSGTYEPAFAKNTGFNKNFGTVAGTVSQGDHNHDTAYISIVGSPDTGNFPTLTAGGELVTSAYGPSDFAAIGHDHSGTYEPAFTKNTGFNKDLGTGSGEVAEGNHNHNAAYSAIGHDHDSDYAAIGHNHSGTYEPAFAKNTGFNKNLGTSAGTVSEGNHAHSGVYLPIGGGTLTGALTLNADPTAGLHAATKQYVDNNLQGFSTKTSVRCSTTGNISLTGEQTLDGVLTSTDRVLVKAQSDPAENGIYVSAAGAWSRATDADAWDELVSAFVLIQEGTVHADQGWNCTSNQGGTLGTTDVVWAQFSGAGGNSALDDITDVTITAPSDNHVLYYDSGTWINGELPSGSVAKTISSPGGWTLSAGDLYYSTFNHALSTTQIVVFGYDDTTKKEIRFEDVEIIDSNNIRVYVRGNSHNDLVVNCVTGKGPSGAAGADGAVWHNGAGAPAGGTGAVGDYYINNSNGDYYEKTGASTWTNRGNLEGPAGGVSDIDDLSDVDTTTAAPSTGDKLAWDGSNWVPETEDHGIDYLNDVDTTTSAPSVDDILQWDGSNWVPVTEPAHVVRIGHTWAISGEVKVASGDTDFLLPFFVSLATGQTAKIVKARYMINSGTSCNVKIQKNGVDVTGFTNITVNTTANNTDPTDVSLANDDKLAMVINSVVSAPTNLSFTLFLEYTF